MTFLLNKSSLYNTFGVDNFNNLEDAVNNMAPSMVEYYLNDLREFSEDTYLNKSQIESSLFIGDYSLYIDYSDNIYLELDNDALQPYETGTFW